jgi:uncharacterized membrane protein
MATASSRSLILDHLIKLDDSKVIGIVIAVLIVLITIGKLIYILIREVCRNVLTYGRVEYSQCSTFTPEFNIFSSSVLAI